MQVAVVILLALSSAASYARAAFLDLMLGCCALWCNLDFHRRWSPERYKGVIVATVV